MSKGRRDDGGIQTDGEFVIFFFFRCYFLAGDEEKTYEKNVCSRVYVLVGEAHRNKIGLRAKTSAFDLFQRYNTYTV